MILISSWSRLCQILWSLVLSREWRCSWNSADRRCSNYIWVIDSLTAYQGASYIRDVAVLLLAKVNVIHRISYRYSLKSYLHSLISLSFTENDSARPLIPKMIMDWINLFVISEIIYLFHSIENSCIIKCPPSTIIWVLLWWRIFTKRQIIIRFYILGVSSHRGLT